jgi:NAD(P)-dependent dehydrogenase (short-subunit alcohol dehydrogenase family)
VTAPAQVKPAQESFAGDVFDACEALGAHVRTCSCAPALTEEQVDAQIQAPDGDSEVQSATAIALLDGPALFAAGGLSGCLDLAWSATRAIVNLRLLPAGRGGRIVYLAPSPGAGEGAEAARAALENLTRTLSVEWARHQITLVTVALADTSTSQQLAALVAYLASPAGAYFSGCQLDLRGV